ncbi:DUF5130 family protein [Kibdelosporangium phytohabitans]|uniref:DUF5130 domain-containing protein n=1 Tax=Kibdelosporangium phytohabitans TaxID=860235 RepID=A0A0N9II80_9PSEU|nr:DUF5130 family protein [Kibdelosporangium phytohabitans]ALG14710.1 hypothetical protein AOZ06_11310 [Kibdelosporangium phytohabitans]MBE1471678.1 hypothetical protein [Kibdelosporangium phytohabitans]
MAAGEVVKAGPAVIDESQLPEGTVVTNTGRLSIARPYEEATPPLPFTPVQLSRLDEALTLASRAAKLAFSVYLGPLGDGATPDTRAEAERMHATSGDVSNSVLIAVSPGQRVVELVTGEEASRRLPDRGLKLVVMALVASFKEGDLVGGLVSGLRMLADQAGTPVHPS